MFSGKASQVSAGKPTLCHQTNITAAAGEHMTVVVTVTVCIPMTAEWGTPLQAMDLIFPWLPFQQCLVECGY